MSWFLDGPVKVLLDHCAKGSFDCWAGGTLVGASESKSATWTEGATGAAEGVGSVAGLVGREVPGILLKKRSSRVNF